MTAGGPILGSIRGETVSGYEIHTGETVSSSPVFEDDGCISESGLVFGTYLHGVFENENVRRALFEYIYAKKGISLQDVSFDVMSREEGIKEFAEVFEGCVDMSAIRKLIE